MRTTWYHFVLAGVFTSLSAGVAVRAESETRFDGPYHVKITASKRVRATVMATYRYPHLAAWEWWVAYPIPPEFEGQPAVRGRIQVADVPLAEVDRITDESALRQPLVMLHWMPKSREGGQGFTVDANYELTVNRRRLEPGEPALPVPELARARRSAFLAPSNHFDFTSPRFRAWLRKEDLKRRPGERDLDFAYRAMETMVRTYTYRFEPRSDRSASAVCSAGWSDCGGLSTVYVSILRANGIPARCLSGRKLEPDGPHVRMDFYAEKVGWVPGDPAMAIGAHSADAGFGRERFDMVIMHFDLIRMEHDYCWLQGIGVVRSKNDEAGSAAGMTLNHTMTVEALRTAGGLATETSSPGNGPRRRKAAKPRLRSP